VLREAAVVADAEPELPVVHDERGPGAPGREERPLVVAPQVLLGIGGADLADPVDHHGGAGAPAIRVPHRGAHHHRDGVLTGGRGQRLQPLVVDPAAAPRQQVGAVRIGQQRRRVIGGKKQFREYGQRRSRLGGLHHQPGRQGRVSGHIAGGRSRLDRRDGQGVGREIARGVERGGGHGATVAPAHTAGAPPDAPPTSRTYGLRIPDAPVTIDSCPG
jgi:hypothetical protein